MARQEPTQAQKDKNRAFNLLGIDLYNRYHREGISDREFITYCIKRIKEVKQNIKQIEAEAKGQELVNDIRKQATRPEAKPNSFLDNQQRLKAKLKGASS